MTRGSELRLGTARLRLEKEMKNIMRETVGSARWREKVDCRELLSMLWYREKNANGFKNANCFKSSSDQKCLGHNQKAPIPLAPPSRAEELQRAASVQPLRMCRSTVSSGMESSARRTQVPPEKPPVRQCSLPAADTVYCAHMNTTCKGVKAFHGGNHYSWVPYAIFFEENACW